MNSNELKRRRIRNKNKKNIRRFTMRMIIITVMFTLILIGVNLSINKKSSNVEISNNIRASVNRLVEAENDDENLIICIDPGHGDWDVGAEGIMGTLEKDINLSVALKLGEMLSKVEGISVKYTRKDDTLNWDDNSRTDLYSRVEYSNNYNADLFISIHCNSSYETSYYGVETWYKPLDESSESLANYIQNQLSILDYTEDRGIKTYNLEEPLIVLEHTDATSVLVELGFISNYYDESILSSNYWQNLMAEAMYNGILEYKDTLQNL